MKQLSRRTVVLGGAAVLVAGGAVAATTVVALNRRDALAQRVLGELETWSAWLEREGVTGTVGELGIPVTGVDDDVDAWALLLDAYCSALEDHGIGATAWAAGRAWGPGYPLAVYVEDRPDGPIARSTPSAVVLEGHRATMASPQGVCLAGWEFSVSGSGGPGAREGAQVVATGEDLIYLADQGVGLVRLAMTWEVLQPALGSGLDPEALAALDSMLAAARAALIDVVLDLHNYGRYTEESGQVLVLGASGAGSLAAEDLEDLWLRLSRWLRRDDDRSGVVTGLGLMNEPHDLPGDAITWEAVSQRVVAGLRADGDGRAVHVAGYSWSALVSWAENHPRAWIDDPAGAVVYEAHHYFDTASAPGSRSGTYEVEGGGLLTYAEELRAAEKAAPDV